jgi:hypothetical protein
LGGEDDDDDADDRWSMIEGLRLGGEGVVEKDGKGMKSNATTEFKEQAKGDLRSTTTHTYDIYIYIYAKTYFSRNK